MSIKTVLENMQRDLHDMSQTAHDALANKNLSDVLKAAAAKVQQCMDHPDVNFDQTPQGEQLPLGNDPFPAVQQGT